MLSKGNPMVIDFVLSFMMDAISPFLYRNKVRVPGIVERKDTGEGTLYETGFGVRNMLNEHSSS
jgi:hypothetical protein